MKLIYDAHTHSLAQNAIVNREASDEFPCGLTFSVGVHPWHADRFDLSALTEATTRSNVVAIGECGLDRLKGPAPDIQIPVFEAQAALSEELGKPLIVHCVKAFDELLATHRRLKPIQPWIIHSFRGKPQQARQLLDQGFYLSLGPSFNPATARHVPAERLLIETDDHPGIYIEDVAAKVAEARGCTTGQILTVCSTNLHHLFQKNA